MKLLKKKWVIVLFVLVSFLVLFLCNPFLRVKAFVCLNHSAIEETLLTSNSVPVIWGVDSYNSWEGSHNMVEFILFSSGFGSETVYYGCYYSYDDIPFAFQNYDTELVQNGHAYWEWTGEGDNWGATQRIRDNWFYFEASF